MALCRIELGLTVTEVAKMSQNLKDFVQVTAEQLYAWELGEDEPELEQLETLSEVYQRPVGYFLEDVSRKEHPGRRLVFSFGDDYQLGNHGVVSVMAAACGHPLVPVWEVCLHDALPMGEVTPDLAARAIEKAKEVGRQLRAVCPQAQVEVRISLCQELTGQLASRYDVLQEVKASET